MTCYFIYALKIVFLISCVHLLKSMLDIFTQHAWGLKGANVFYVIDVGAFCEQIWNDLSFGSLAAPG